jgi:hypothetical protein
MHFAISSKLIRIINKFSMVDDVKIKYSHTFTSFLAQKNCCFNALFLNINSLRNKLNSLSNFIKFHRATFHIIILNETKIESHEKHLFNIPFYHSFHSTRKKDGGGVSIFLLKSFSNAEESENYEYENSNFLLLKLSKFNINIAGIYKPPTSNSSNFLVRLDEMLDKYPHSYFFGDFNMNLFNPRHALVSEYTTTVESNGFHILNSRNSSMFTRHDKFHNTYSCIDHIFTDEIISNSFSFYTDNILGSDHRALLLSVVDETPTIHPPSKKHFTISTTNHEKIVNENLLDQISTDSFSNLIRELSEIISQNTKKVVIRQKFRKPFMDSTIYNYMVIRENYRALLKLYPNSLSTQERLKFYRNKVTSLIRSKRKIENEKLFSNGMSDSRKTWKNINNLLANRDSLTTETCQKICINGQIITEKLEIANNFNDFFVNVASTIKNSITPNPPLDDYYRNLENYQITSPAELSETSEKEIFEIISNLKSSEAKDTYGMSNNMLKLHKKALAKPLSVLINKSIGSGDFPRCLKTAVVKPIHKDSDKKNVSNYRPIAILPIVSKVFEHVMLDRLTKHLSKNKVVNDYQFGFVAKSNTEIAVIHLLSNVYKNIEEKKLTAALFLDLSKAFDCLNHSVFLDKMRKIKLPTNFQNLFESYFSDRSQCVDVDGTQSPPLKIIYGTFQGSILGPMTFICYVNGIFNLKLHGVIQLYADDIVLVYGEMSPKLLKLAIETDLATIQAFLNAHFLAINATKTKYILFPGRVQKAQLRNFKIDFQGGEIEQVESMRYLGLVIDKYLKFEDHISFIARKMTSMIYAIKRIRHKVNVQVLYQLYFSHVYSHLIFMNPIWSVAAEGTTNKLFVLQKKALRFIQFKDRLSPSIDLFSQKILPLSLINDFHLLVLAFKIKHNMIKNNVTLQYVRDIHNYGTRQSNNFYVYTHETRYGEADFYKRGLIKFNELRDNLKSIPSLGNFKNEVREYLFREYK